MNRAWPSSRIAAVGIWFAVAGYFLLTQGLPFDRATQAIFIISAALAFSVGTRTGAMRIFADWIPFFALLYGYDYSRGAADTYGMTVRVEEIVNIEKHLTTWLFNGQIPNVWLQQHFYDPNQVQWWEAIVALTYCSHFIVPWTLVGVLYVRNRRQWARFARRVIAMSMAALVTYFLVPAAPPWYAAKAGLIEPVARIATRGWSIVGLPIAGQIIQLGQGVANAVAAIPSLHCGMAFTITFFFWPKANIWLRSFLVFYCAAMVFTLVFGGEHYLFDCLLGILYAVIVEGASRVWERRR